MENGPFIVDFPIKNGGSFHSKMLVYQRVMVNSSKKTTFSRDWLPSVGPFCGPFNFRLPKSPAAPATPPDLMQHRPGMARGLGQCRQFHTENVGTWWEKVGQWLENLRKQWLFWVVFKQNVQSGGENDIVHNKAPHCAIMFVGYFFFTICHC